MRDENNQFIANCGLLSVLLKLFIWSKNKIEIQQSAALSGLELEQKYGQFVIAVYPRKSVYFSANVVYSRC